MSSKWRANPWNSFLDFSQVAFWAGQEKANDFPESGDHLKHRFFDLNKVEFWACQEEDIPINCDSTTWFVALSTWNKSYFQLSRSRECVQSDFRQIESLLFRLHSNRILGWSRRWKWDRSALQPLKMSFFTSPKSHFWQVQRPKVVEIAMRDLGTLFYRPQPRRIVGW